jgi:hypothetical protein
MEFEPTISAGERLQTYALARAATGTGFSAILVYFSNNQVGAAVHKKVKKRY